MDLRKDCFEVFVANRVLDEGVDVPEAKVAVVIGGQASTRQAKQRLGRILAKIRQRPCRSIRSGLREYQRSSPFSKEAKKRCLRANSPS